MCSTAARSEWLAKRNSDRTSCLAAPRSRHQASTAAAVCSGRPDRRRGQQEPRTRPSGSRCRLLPGDRRDAAPAALLSALHPSPAERNRRTARAPRPRSRRAAGCARPTRPVPLCSPGPRPPRRPQRATPGRARSRLPAPPAPHSAAASSRCRSPGRRWCGRSTARSPASRSVRARHGRAPRSQAGSWPGARRCSARTASQGTRRGRQQRLARRIIDQPWHSMIAENMLIQGCYIGVL